MPNILVTPIVSEPISLDEAKTHLRVDITDDDLLISALISAVRDHAEKITWRGLATQQRKLVMDQFPIPGLNMAIVGWYAPPFGSAPGPLSMQLPKGTTGYEMFMPFPPLQTIDSIKYIDGTGVQQTLDPSQYLVDAVSEPARVTPAYGLTWPVTQVRINAVEVTFTCGYPACPEGVKRWMLIRLSTL